MSLAVGMFQVGLVEVFQGQLHYSDEARRNVGETEREREMIKDLK